MRIAGQRAHVHFRVFIHPGRHLRIHLCDASRRQLQTVALWVFADAFQNQSNATRDFFKVNSLLSFFCYLDSPIPRFLQTIISRQHTKAQRTN
jgi:hypothetical protein